MRAAFGDGKFAVGPFAALWGLLAPAGIDVKAGERLVRIDKQLSEYTCAGECAALRAQSAATRLACAVAQ
jgi:hypothetical protein